MSERARHWEAVYSARRPDELSWYQPRPDISLRLVDALGVDRHAPVVDVGGGASTLVDHLLALGFDRVTVLDISAAALAAARARLGPRAAAVRWREADITRDDPGGPYRLWHDRAVFHFLTEAADRTRYGEAMSRALPSGAHAIVATFDEGGPERCSNLPVRRYAPEALGAEFGPGFELVDALRESHLTPAGKEQNFAWCCLRRR